MADIDILPPSPPRNSPEPLGMIEETLPEDPSIIVRRPTRQRRVPRGFEDMVPSRLLNRLQQYSRAHTPATEPPSFPLPPSHEEISRKSQSLSPSRSPSPELEETEPNSFGLFRIYKKFPSRIPRMRTQLTMFQMLRILFVNFQLLCENHLTLSVQSQPALAGLRHSVLLRPFA